MGDPREAARVALRALYRKVAEDLASRPGLFCRTSGRCCRFREAGHELWLTRLEYEGMEDEGGPREGVGTDACPWLENGLCANREGRALACRTYFCSDEAQANGVTERWHAEIRRLHREFDIPYEYRRLADYRNQMPGTASQGV